MGRLGSVWRSAEGRDCELALVDANIARPQVAVIWSLMSMEPDLVQSAHPISWGRICALPLSDVSRSAVTEKNEVGPVSQIETIETSVTILPLQNGTKWQ